MNVSFYLIVIHFLIYSVISICKFYISLKFYNRIKLICFLKFVVHKINSEMIKFEMVVLIKKY
jgi:hypothetical protein